MTPSTCLNNRLITRFSTLYILVYQGVSFYCAGTVSYMQSMDDEPMSSAAMSDDERDEALIPWTTHFKTQSELKN